MPAFIEWVKRALLEVQEYTNPVGVAAPAITDTSAFPVCDQ